MRRNPTNKTKTATVEIVAKIQALKGAMAEAAQCRTAVLDFMGDASFLTNSNGDVIAQRVRTKTGCARLELTE